MESYLYPNKNGRYYIYLKSRSIIICKNNVRYTVRDYVYDLINGLNRVNYQFYKDTQFSIIGMKNPLLISGLSQNF